MAPITGVCVCYFNSDYNQRGSCQLVHVHYPHIDFGHSGLQFIPSQLAASAADEIS